MRYSTWCCEEYKGGKRFGINPNYKFCRVNLKNVNYNILKHKKNIYIYKAKPKLLHLGDYQ